jgi:beta-lactamase class A
MQEQKQPSFFVVRMMVIGLLVVIGSMTLLPSGGASAQARLTHTSGITHSSSVTHSGGIMNAAVYDLTRGRYYTYGGSGLFVPASSMKVPIMLTFFDMIERQGRGPSNYESVLLRTMIENSNNDSASALYYHEIGGAAGVARYMQRIGITGLYPNPYHWGWSQITPWAMVNMLTRLYEGTILTAHDRNLSLYLMRHVEADQREGVGDTAPVGATIALKDGWVVGPDGLWAMNSSGIVTLGQETYIIAAYTKANPSLGAGIYTVRQICAQVAAQLH